MPSLIDPPHRAEVVEALEATRNSMRRHRAVSDLIVLGFMEIGLAALVILADVTWVIPTQARAAGLGLMAGLAFAYLARMLVGPGRKYGKHDAAIEVESAFPELGQRVRTTLEYAEPTAMTAPASASLVGALAAQTDRQTRGLEFSTLVPWANFRRSVFGLAALVVVVVVVIANDPNLAIAARRLMLSPAHYTTLDVQPGDKTVKAGSEFSLKATIGGRAVPSAGWLRRPLGGDKPWVAASIAPEPSSRLVGPFDITLKDCQADFEYKVVAGEVETPVYHVKVVHPLVLKSIEVSVLPPAYTRKPPSVAITGDFAAVEGSSFGFKFVLDRAPKSARITWRDADGPGSKTNHTVSLSIHGAELIGELPPLARDVRYEVVADAADGVKLEPTSYLIKVKPDARPTIAFLKPAESFAATATTEVPIKVEAGDDHGVARVGIAYQVDDGPEQSLYLDSPSNQPPSVEALATLYLENHPLDFNSSLSYFAFVEDNKRGKPNRTTTELRYIDILPYKQEYAMSEASPGGDGGPPSGSSASLEELIARQRQVLNRTFAHLDDSPVDHDVVDRLSKLEAELAIATEDFAKGLAARSGPVPPLEDAVRSLRSATVTLLENDIKAALPTEQSALASLVQARKNLRKLLSPSSPSAAQCQKFDRQQEQKLRKPPTAEDKPREAQLARLEQDVRKLADDQKQFANEIEPKGGGGARFDRQSKAVKEVDRLKKLAGEDNALSELARSRMEAAASEVKKAESLRKDGQASAAAEAAREAAADLDRLADHVSGLKSKDLAARLARARELAQETAKAERALAREANEASPADDPRARQQALADSAATLADLVKRLRSDAVEENRTLGQAIDRSTQTNAPAEIERAMRTASTPRVMDEAATKLEGLARDLESARREFVQPQLEQLIAAERKAAEVDRSMAAGDKLASEKGLGELAKALEALKTGEGSIREASEALDKAVHSVGAGAWSSTGSAKLAEGVFAAPRAIDDAVGVVAKALQAKIQELILNSALVDRDGPVPPGYKQMVQDYFRVLSDDLR